MTQETLTVWKCDGACGTQVTTKSGDVPDGWMFLNVSYSINVVSPDKVVSAAEQKIFHGLPCLTEWETAWYTSVSESGLNLT